MTFIEDHLYYIYLYETLTVKKGYVGIESINVITCIQVL